MGVLIYNYTYMSDLILMLSINMLVKCNPSLMDQSSATPMRASMNDPNVPAADSPDALSGTP